MRFDLTNASYRVLCRAALSDRLPFPSSDISAAKLLISLFEEEECRAAVWLCEAGLSLDFFLSDFSVEEDLVRPVSANDTTAVEKKEIGSGNDYGEKNVRSRIRFFLDDAPVNVGRLSADLELSLGTVTHHFARPVSGKRRSSGSGGVATIFNGATDYFPAFLLATEHLLVAATLTKDRVGHWLRDHGFEATELVDRIEGLNQVDVPLDLLPDGHESANAVLAAAPVGRQPCLPAASESCASKMENDVRVYRLIDAVINRAREAVRVVEDYLRFILDDESMTRRLKDFRHQFQEVSRIFCDSTRLASRNTPGDVGTVIEGSGEYRRASSHDVLSANFSRLQESLRSLEEYSKLVQPQAAKSYEKLRYRCYALHKDVCLSLPASEGTVWESNGPDENAKDHVKTILAEARLYALVDCRRDEEAFAAMIAALVEGGVDVLQLRDKRVDDRMLLGRSEILQQIISKSERRVLFIMNDRPDLARLARADGVHVGQEELSVEQIKKIVGERMLIGVSTHDIEQVRRACLDGADYIGVGPVFASSTKHFDQTVGLEFLKQVFREMDSKAQMPAFAIGGISLDNLDDVLATGITRVAVGAALTEAENPRLAAQQFREGVLQAAETAREPEKPRPS